MWCCWISPDHNSVSIQRSPRTGYRAAQVFKAEARVSIRLIVRPPGKD
jgi:hypothetical protein